MTKSISTGRLSDLGSGRSIDLGNGRAPGVSSGLATGGVFCDLCQFGFVLNSPSYRYSKANPFL